MGRGAAHLPEDEEELPAVAVPVVPQLTLVPLFEESALSEPGALLEFEPHQRLREEPLQMYLLNDNVFVQTPLFSRMWLITQSAIAPFTPPHPTLPALTCGCVLPRLANGDCVHLALSRALDALEPSLAAWPQVGVPSPLPVFDPSATPLGTVEVAFTELPGLLHRRLMHQGTILLDALALRLDERTMGENVVASADALETRVCRGLTYTTVPSDPCPSCRLGEGGGCYHDAYGEWAFERMTGSFASYLQEELLSGRVVVGPAWDLTQERSVVLIPQQVALTELGLQLHVGLPQQAESLRHEYELALRWQPWGDPIEPGELQRATYRADPGDLPPAVCAHCSREHCAGLRLLALVHELALRRGYLTASGLDAVTQTPLSVLEQVALRDWAATRAWTPSPLVGNVFDPDEIPF